MARSSPAQISIRGTLETMLTYKLFKTIRAPTDIVEKKKDIFQIVVTPDRIPKFIIPSLEVDHVFLHFDPAECHPEVKKDLHRAGQEVVLSPRARRSHSESNIKNAHLLRGRSLQRKISELSYKDLEKAVDHSDPPTRAALSLPHLPKITTPYGFLMLGEIPNIRRKESLFFDPDVSSPSILPLRQHNVSIARKLTGPQKKPNIQKDNPKTPKKPARSISCDLLCCSASSFPQPLANHTKSCEKKMMSFWKRKQLPGRKFLESCRESREKRHASVGRTQSNPIA